SGILYWAAYTTQGELRVIDTTTGASTLIGPFPDGTEVDCLAFTTRSCGGAQWLSEEPVTGTVAAGSCEQVAVTLDATGMEAGSYTAGLAIQSNDADEPVVRVPVTMTVDEPVTGASFYWSPEEPVAGETIWFTATAGPGTPPFSFQWEWG